MHRTFIAINIPLLDTIRDSFSSISISLKNEKIKWVDPKQLHITLKFLGDTEESTIPSIKEKLSRICDNTSPFDLQIKGSGIFKNYRNPRVIWLGLEESENLQNLHHAIDEVMTDFGFKPETKTFRPHLTLGRIKWIDDLSLLKDTLEKYKNKDFGTFTTDQVIFYQSILTPKGPEYSSLGKFNLNS